MKKGLTCTLIVCTKNRLHDMAQCLHSITLQTRPPDELIIVDSGAESAEELVRDCAARVTAWSVQYLRSEPGLTRQRNAGIRAATKQIVHFLDDDVILDPGYVQAIQETYESPGNEDVVAVGGTPSLPYSVAKTTQRYMRLFLWAPLDGDGRMKASGFPSFTWYAGFHDVHQVDVLTGCSCSFRAEIFDRIQFDEWFDGYGFMEDVEFSYRASRLGRVLVTPNARLVHHLSQAERTDNRRLIAMEIVNHHYVFKKHLPQNAFHWMCFWWSECGAALWRLCKAAKSANSGIVLGMLHGYWAIVVGQGISK